MEICGCGGDNSTTPPDKKLIDSVVNIPIRLIPTDGEFFGKITPDVHDILVDDLINCAGWG